MVDRSLVLPMPCTCLCADGFISVKYKINICLQKFLDVITESVKIVLRCAALCLTLAMVLPIALHNHLRILLPHPSQHVYLTHLL